MAKITQVTDGQAIEFKEENRVAAPLSPLLSIVKGSDTGDKHTLDLIFPRAVNDLGCALDSRHVVVVGMIVADGDDVGADFGRV